MRNLITLDWNFQTGNSKVKGTNFSRNTCIMYKLIRYLSKSTSTLLHG